MLFLKQILVLTLMVVPLVSTEDTEKSKFLIITTRSPKLRKWQTSLNSLSNNSNESDHCYNSLSKSSGKDSHYSCSGSSVNLCPIWFSCNDTASGECQCGPACDDNIRCDERRMVSAVLNCFCITKSNNEVYSGYCFYNCERHVHNKVHDKLYHEIPDKVDLNEYMCGRFSRMGISCGQCINGTSPLVLSYNLSCVECPEGHKNWWKFVLAGFIPLTIFCFLIVFFNINVTSSRLHGTVLFSQAISTPTLIRVTLLAITEDLPSFLKIVKFIVPFYSLWNLDPFRSVFPDICLDVTTLQAFALDVCLAVYPLMLICVCYCLIELHDRKVWCIVCMWKPFSLILRLFRENWDIRTSIIDSFATFFLLSYVKILSVSMDLMLYTPVHELYSNQTHYRLYYAGNIKLFDREHIPFAAISMTLLMIFIIIPTAILILYPFRCFQKFLSYYSMQWHFLHAFVDSFQGCYKDGTDPGTYDLRWLSCYGFVLRIALCIMYFFTLSSMYFVYAAVVILFVTILLINFQPYKTYVAHYTKIDVSFMILLSFVYTTITGNNVTVSNRQMYLNIFNVLGVISCIVQIIYMNFIVLHWIYSRRKWGRMVLTRITVWMKDH